MNTKQRDRHNARARRKMELANLAGQELDEWLDLAARRLTESIEEGLAHLRGLQSVIRLTSPDISELERETQLWATELQKSIDDLSVLGPDGRAIPFGVVRDPLLLDAALEHSLVMQERIVTNTNERLGDVEKALSRISSDEEVGQTLRQIGAARARLAQMAAKLREAIEL